MTMKTREGYVSNSSSSSFIVEAFDGIESLTGDDWRGMLRELYKDYDKAVERHRRHVLENGFEDWAYPFCAFDLRTERAEAEKELHEQLDGWIASNSRLVDGKIERCDFDVEEDWRDFCDSVSEEIEERMLESHEDAHVWLSAETRDGIRNEYNRVIVWDKGREATELPVDEEYLKRLEEKWDSLGVCTNADVLASDRACFAVHFDENEYCGIVGVCDNDGWETEPYTYDRLCEIFGKWLASHGKVPAGFDWHSFLDHTLTVNMHEG